jgi:hexokinase
VVLLASVALTAPRYSPSTHEILKFFTGGHQGVGISLRNPVVVFDKNQDVCPVPEPKQHAHIQGTFNKDTDRNMALADQAKRVAAEFDFGPDAVRSAVKEFIREMGRFGRL